MRLRKILIAVDEGPIAAYAASAGLELASRLKAQVAFIHVIDPKTIAAPESGIPAGELLAEAKRESKGLLDSFRSIKPRQAGRLAFTAVGRPAVEIAKTAKRWSSDLVVIGSHGRGGVGRVLLGSVAEAAARRSPCPVLIVRAKA